MSVEYTTNINFEKIMQPFSLHYFTIFKSLCTTVDNLQEIFFRPSWLWPYDKGHKVTPIQFSLWKKSLVLDEVFMTRFSY